MIDWDKSFSLYGTAQAFATQEQLISISCDICGKTTSKKFKLYKRTLKKMKNYLCLSCRVKEMRKEKPENYKRSKACRIKLSDKFRQKWSDKSYRKRMTSSFQKSAEKYSIAAKKNWQNPVYREKVITTIHQKYADPQYQEFMSQIYASEQYRKKLSGNWQDQQYREKVLARWSNPELMKLFKEGCSRRQKLVWQNPNFREKIKKKWQDPIFREKMARILANMPRVSSLQIRLYEILENNKVQFYREGDQTVIGPYAFDCLIPKQGNMQKHLLIDCHGEYFHNLPKQIPSDAAKASYISNNLSDQYDYHILWEQWYLFRGKVEQQIKIWMGQDINVDVVDFDFKDVMVSDKLTYREAADFLSRFHYIYSCPRGSYYAGAYLKDELIGACLFSPLIRQNIAQSIRPDLKHNEVSEISRFCIHPKYQKRNFASWLLTRSINMFKQLSSVKVIVAYSDKTVGHQGTIYKACGFVNDKVVSPDYWYVDDAGWVIHKRTLYGRAIKMSMTEKEYALKHGYRKVFGKEKLRFVKFS